MTTYCNVYMCLPTGGSVIALDGTTQIPVTVYYAIWEQTGSQVVQLDASDTTVQLVFNADFTWYDGNKYKEGDDITKAGWYYSTTPGPDVLVGIGGCSNLPPPGSLVKYTPVNFYVGHTFGTAQDIQKYINSNTGLTGPNPNFDVAASVTRNGNTWYTSSTKRNIHNAAGGTTDTVPLKLGDGTPTLTPYLGTLTSNDTIDANGNSYIQVYLGFTIVTPTGQGGTGNPLSTQKSNSAWKLITNVDGSDLNGYTPPEGDSYGQWIVGDSGADNSSYSGLPNNCKGCNANSPIPQNAVYQIYSVSHGQCYIKRQSVQVAMQVLYKPNGATEPIEFNTDATHRAPIACCIPLIALGVH